MSRARFVGLLVPALLLGLIHVIPAPAASASSSPSVVPRLTSWSGGQGQLRLTDESRILVHPEDRHRVAVATMKGPDRRRGQTLAEVAKVFQSDIRELTGLSLRIGSAARTARAGDLVLGLKEDRKLGSEGYSLHIGQFVDLSAATSTGVYYGTRTVLQMLAGDPQHRAVPRGSTRDVPTQRMRMVMLDAARKYWEMDYLKNLIRRMSWMKLNTLYMQFSDAQAIRLDSARFPELTEPESSYSRDEIAELQHFASRHHVMLIPGIDMPGHATALSNAFQIGFGDYPRSCDNTHTHGHLTIDWVIDITEERSRATAEMLLDEFLPWFNAPYAHIGADELPPQLAKCPKVQRYIAENPDVSSLGDLSVDFINEMAGVVAAHGKRTIIYNGVETMKSPQQDVRSNVIFMTWDDTATGPEIPGHDEIAVGPFYVTPNNYHNLYPDEAWMYDTWTPSRAPDMLGSGVMNWGDYNYWADDLYFERNMADPRAILADRSWNGSPTPDSVESFLRRVAAIGEPPGFEPPQRPPRIDNGKPSHHYTFDRASYPPGWVYASRPPNTILAEDIAGDLPGTSYIVWNPTLIEDGVVGEAFRFDHDRDGVGFGGLDIPAPWTASVWVRRTGSTPDSVLLSSKNGAVKLEQHQSGQVGLTRYGDTDYSFDYQLPADRWVQLTLVAKAESTTLYVDGRPVDTVADSIRLPMRSIGAVGTSLRGDLDELVIWDEALSPAHVAAHYAGYDHPRRFGSGG